MNKPKPVLTVALVCTLVLAGGCATTQRFPGQVGFEPESARVRTQDDWQSAFPNRPDLQGLVSFDWDESIFHTGSRSVSIALDPAHPAERIYYNWTRLEPSCQVGRTYEISGWLKTEGLAAPAGIVVQCWDEGESEMVGFASTEPQFAFTGTTDWTEVGTVFVVPEGTVHVRLRAGLPTKGNSGGRVWFDDIQVRDIGQDVATDGPGRLEGMWSGTLRAGTDLRLVLHVERGFRRWRTTLDSVDQGAYGLPVSSLQVDGDQVGFELPDIRASYAGTLVAPDRIEGNWNQGMKLPLNFERGTEPPQISRPQEPVGPFPYAIEKVAYTFDPDHIRQTLVSPAKVGQGALITIKGTLTLPPGAGPHPAVLLITGSGPQDRDETLMNHKPFWVLADYLSRHGLAVLRVDDRGTAQSTGDFAAATTADFAQDAAAGFLFLQQRADIDPERVALLGHSEGGLVAPLVASEYPGVAAIVLMAGPGVRGREVLRLQQRLLLEAQGAPAGQVAAMQEQQQAIFDILCSGLTEAEVTARLDAFFGGTYEGLTAAQQEAVGSREAYLEAAKEQVGTPWMRWFLAHDPAPTLAQVACPVLAVNGAKDLQVDPGQNLPAVAAALAAGGNQDFATVELPGLNHLFQHCETCTVAEYGLIEETLAPEFLETVGRWLGERLEVSR